MRRFLLDGWETPFVAPNSSPWNRESIDRIYIYIFNMNTHSSEPLPPNHWVETGRDDDVNICGKFMITLLDDNEHMMGKWWEHDGGMMRTWRVVEVAMENDRNNGDFMDSDLWWD